MVACAPQDLCNRHAPLVEESLVRAGPPRIGAQIHHRAHPGLVRIDAGQQCGSAWAANGAVVQLGKTEPVASQCIEIGRRNLGAITPEVREAEVVGQYQDDVWTRIPIRSRSQRSEGG